MPGTIQVSVIGIIDLQTSSPGSSKTSIKVAMGKLEYQTSDSGDYIFPVTRLRENLIVTLLDVNGNGILHREIETRVIIESGFLEENLSFNGYRNVQLKMQFVLSQEDRNRIRYLRQSALRKKHEELMHNGSFFTKSKSIASDLSSLSQMKTEDTANDNAAVAIQESNLGLSQETKLNTNADREPDALMWKSKVSDTVEKTKYQPSSSDVSEVKNLENVWLVKQEGKGLGKPERNPKRKSMRRSMSETNLSSVRKMISTFEIKVTQDKKIQTRKIRTDSCEDAKEKTKAESHPGNAVKLEKAEERKISFEDVDKSERKDNTERCHDLVPIVPRDAKRVVIEEKSLEESTIRSDSLSNQRRKRSSVVEVRDEEKKTNNSVRLKQSQLNSARGSRLWIFPDEAKDLSCETDSGTRHLDLAEANLLPKKTEGSTMENIGEREFRCRSTAKMNSNNKWKHSERSKKEKSETSADSDSSRKPVGQVMRALIVAGFASLVFLTRQRN